jgi:hypothetical protein
MERGGVSSIAPHLWKTDNEIEELYDIYTDQPVAAPAPSDSSTGSLFGDEMSNSSTGSLFNNYE